MTSNSRIPPLLTPYILSLPKASLVLLTNTLGTSSNWLVIRYLYGTLSGDAASHHRVPAQGNVEPALAAEDGGNVATGNTAVVLVSWSRDFEFWRTETRRATGLDLTQLSHSNRFAFVDGLTSLYSPSPSHLKILPTRELPVRSVTGTTPTPRAVQPTRKPTVPLQSSIQSGADSRDTPQASLANPPALHDNVIHKLMSTNAEHTRDTITKAIESLAKLDSAASATNDMGRNARNRTEVLLILDAPDLLLALQPDETAQTSSTSSSLSSLLFSLRLHESVCSIVLNLSSDINPLPSILPPNHIPSPLETESQALLVGLAHQADLVIGCRGLKTGGAGDVSGVLRITVSDEADEDSMGSSIETTEWKEQELLYLVRNDGTAKVWERGAGA